MLKLDHIFKSFRQGDDTIDVLKDASFHLKEEEAVALLGQSGAGKTTFLQIAALLDGPTSGQIQLDQKDVDSKNDSIRTDLRRNYLGFVYQFHYLLDEFTALENVMMPCLIKGMGKREATEKAIAILEKVGLSNRMKHRPFQLSGGEQQRVAIARALAHEPKILLADEPTGNLDPKTAQIIMDILLSVVKEKSISLLIVTHNHDIAKMMDRSITLQNGSIVDYQ